MFAVKAIKVEHLSFLYSEGAFHSPIVYATALALDMLWIIPCLTSLAQNFFCLYTGNHDRYETEGLQILANHKYHKTA
jgi:hypothetical protein